MRRRGTALDVRFPEYPRNRTQGSQKVGQVGGC